MSKTVSVDERLLKSYRAELARRTTFFNRRPRRGVTRAYLDEIQLHIDLFAAAVAHARRVEVTIDGTEHAGAPYVGFGPMYDPHLPFDASHWLARNPWYEG